MYSTKWQLGWACRSVRDPDQCLIERLSWLGSGRPYFGRRILCRYHEVELSESIISHMAGEQAKLMKESVISRAKILDERDCQEQLEHTPVMSTTLKDVRDVIHGGCCQQEIDAEVRG